MVVICDIDGTIADTYKEPTPPFGTAGYYNWMEKYMKDGFLVKEEAIREVVEIVQALSEKHCIVYLTGRDEEHRTVTNLWLLNHDLPEGPLYMRQKRHANDTPAQYKEKQLRKIVKLYGVAGIALDDDDRGDTSAIYLKYGFKHLKVIK